MHHGALAYLLGINALRASEAAAVRIEDYADIRHLPSGHHEINTAWRWGALLAASMAGWLHHLTGTPRPDGTLAGHGVRDGHAMLATLRHRLIRVPGRVLHHAAETWLRLPPGRQLLAEILARLRALPAHP